MRPSRQLFALALLAGALPAATLAPAVAPPAAERAPTSKPAVVAHRAAPTPAILFSKKLDAPRALPSLVAAAPAPATAGMVVAIDPETGQLSMPTAEQLEALGASTDPAVDESDEGLVVIHHPNGMESVDLQGRFQEYVVVRITPDGKKVMGCAPTRTKAARVLTIPANTPAVEEK